MSSVPPTPATTPNAGTAPQKSPELTIDWKNLDVSGERCSVCNVMLNTVDRKQTFTMRKYWFCQKSCLQIFQYQILPLLRQLEKDEFNKNVTWKGGCDDCGGRGDFA